MPNSSLRIPSYRRHKPSGQAVVTLGGRDIYLGKYNSAGSFKGLITENGITRWLGLRAKSNGTHVDLTTVTVKAVLREKDPFLKAIPIFLFAGLDAAVDEVMGLFAARPALEVVLLTRSGDRKTPIEGIITQWDAARYPTV